MKKILTGITVLMMMAGSAYGYETQNERKAREAEARIIKNQAVSNGVKLISSEEAKQIAFQAAGVNANEIKYVKVKLDQEDDYIPVQYIYEIEFLHDGLEYEFDVNSETKKILKSEVDSWLD